MRQGEYQRPSRSHEDQTDRQTCNDMEPYPKKLKYSTPASVGGEKVGGAGRKAATKEEFHPPPNLSLIHI